MGVGVEGCTSEQRGQGSPSSTAPRRGGYERSDSKGRRCMRVCVSYASSRERGQIFLENLDFCLYRERRTRKL